MYKHQHFTLPKVTDRNTLLEAYNQAVKIKFTCKDFLHPNNIAALEQIIDELGWMKDIATNAGVKP